MSDHMMTLDSKEFYLKMWELVLGQFLDWSPSRVREWAAATWGDGLNGKRTWFYHEAPCYYIAPMLIPAIVREGLRGIPLVRLEAQIQAAIEDRGRDPVSNGLHYDWDAAKARVQKAIDDSRSGNQMGRAST